MVLSAAYLITSYRYSYFKGFESLCWKYVSNAVSVGKLLKNN